MSIDDIITLLLILTFVAGPILNRLTKGPQKPQGKGQRPPQNRERPGQPRDASQRTTSTPQTGRDSRRSTQTTSQTTTAPPPKQPESSDPFTKRLEEARRRVQEAMEGGTSQGDVSQKPPERRLVGSESSGGMFRDPSQSQQQPQQQPRQQPASPLTQPPSQRRTLSPEGGAGTQRSIPTQSGGFSRTSAQAAKARIKTPSGTKPLQVQRSVGRKRAKVEGRFLTFGRDDLLRGIVWKQILDEPRGKRPWRNPSQHP